MVLKVRPKVTSLCKSKLWRGLGYSGDPSVASLQSQTEDWNKGHSRVIQGLSTARKTTTCLLRITDQTHCFQLDFHLILSPFLFLFLISFFSFHIILVSLSFISSVSFSFLQFPSNLNLTNVFFFLYCRAKFQDE